MTLPSDKPFRVAVVAIVKDEGRYLPEWIAYHILLGVEHFYLFDNGSTDDSHEVLERFINYGYVTRIDWPLFPGQVDAYNYAARVFGHLSDWLAFLDIDEFAVLKKHGSLPALLEEVDADQLLVFWRVFGHSGHRARPEGLVISNYVRCAAELSPVTKPIVRSDQVQVVQVHNCVTKSGRTVGDRGQSLREDWMHQPAERTEDLIRLNHYFTRSYEEYTAKIERGQVDGRAEKVLEPYEDYDFETEDRMAASRAAAVEDWLRRFGELPPQPHRYGAATAIGALSQPRTFKLYAQAAVEEIVELLPDSGGRLDHFQFGVVATFEDANAAPQVRAAVRERVGDWAAATNGTLEANLDAFELRNGDAADAGTHVDFVASGEDPQIVATVAPDGPLAYHWLVALLVVPEEVEADAFVFGLDSHGEKIRETRRLMLAPGLSLLMLMVSDSPLRLTAGRLDPGSAPGRYEIWDVALVRCM